MIRNGHARVNPPTPTQTDSSDETHYDEESDVDWRYVITNNELQSITNTETIQQFHKTQKNKLGIPYY